MIKTTSVFASVNGVNSAPVVAVLAFVSAREAAISAKDAARKAIKSALATAKAEGVKETVALAALRNALVEGGLAKQRVSEILLELGFRARAVSKKPEENAAAFADLIDQIVALAADQAGDKATAVLRRAYDKAKAKAAAVKAATK